MTRAKREKPRGPHMARAKTVEPRFEAPVVSWSDTLLEHLQTFATLHGLSWVVRSCGWWSVALAPVCLASMMCMDEVRPDMGTIFNGCTSVKLGLLLFHVSRGGGGAAGLSAGTAGWALLLQACAIAMVAWSGRALSNYQLLAIGCALELSIVCHEIVYVSDVQTSAAVAAFELAAEVCSRVARALGLVTLSRFLSTGPDPEVYGLA